MGFFDKLKKGGDALSNLTSKIDKDSLSNFTSKINVESLSDLTSKVDLAATKSYAVKKACEIDYNKSIDGVNKLGKDLPGVTSVSEALVVLRDSADEYNQSSSATKEDEFIERVVNGIDAEKTLKDIEPIVSLIPYGDYIVIALKYIIKKKKGKK